MTLEETIKYYEEEADEQAVLGEWNDDDVCRECAKEYRQRADWLRELEAYRKLYSLENDMKKALNEMKNDIGIKTTLSEIHDIHERIRQCNERYEKRMAELERPVEFYDINGPLKITREEDNNG